MEWEQTSNAERRSKKRRGQYNIVCHLGQCKYSWEGGSGYAVLICYVEIHIDAHTVGCWFQDDLLIEQQ